jgi:hypothetical protein
MSNANLNAYYAPDEVLVDAVYSYENGGVNPVRHHPSAWNTRELERGNCAIRYERIRRTRSSYQGYWEVREEATKGGRNNVH